MTEEITGETDLVTVTWHKETWWTIRCPVLGIYLDSLSLVDVTTFLKTIDIFINIFKKEGAE